MEKFWNKYINADELKRTNMVKVMLKVFKPLINYNSKVFTKNQTNYHFKNLLTSYFNDLISVMEIRTRTIPMEQIKSVLTKPEFIKFQTFLKGQTIMVEGKNDLVYVTDLVRYIKKLPVID